MLEPSFLQVLQWIADRLQGQPGRWAVTGSLGMALQGLPVTVHDIDLQTDLEGAYAVERALQEFVVEPVGLCETETMRSHFGRLQINGLQVEIMGDVQKKNEQGEWEEPVDLPRYTHLALYEGLHVPVLSIAYEAGAYARMGRVEKAAMLQAWANEHAEITAVTNYRLLYPWLGSAGQPTREQISLIAAEGYQTLINLALEDSPNAIPGEAELARANGMQHIHIPVYWEMPELENLQAFFTAMDERKSQNVFVHCVLNMRVSCFLFLYRVLRLGVPEEIARADMLCIWTPDETWSELIDLALSAK